MKRDAARKFGTGDIRAMTSQEKIPFGCPICGRRFEGVYTTRDVADAFLDGRLYLHNYVIEEQQSEAHRREGIRRFHSSPLYTFCLECARERYDKGEL